VSLGVAQLADEAVRRVELVYGQLVSAGLMERAVHLMILVEHHRRHVPTTTAGKREGHACEMSATFAL
jgi:hypothetical protein